jgi:glycosyltransferase involved in cell wall biosynthesis
MSDELPTISVVTPSYNQAQFLEQCLTSVLDQPYPNVEYVVVDGASTDGSVEIIQRHADRLAHWVSEPDDGQYDAINKGFAKTSGEIMAWLNSDDMYTPWALSCVAEVFAALPDVEWLTSLYQPAWDVRGHLVFCPQVPGFHRDAFFRGANVQGRGWYASHFIQQESTFWRRSLWDRAGGFVDASLSLAGDLDLWARFYRLADLYGLRAVLAGFRNHDSQKTALHMPEYLVEAERVLRRHGGRPYGRVESAVRDLVRRLPRRFRRDLLTYQARMIRYDVPTDRWVLETTRFV